MKKVPALRGQLVINLFMEPSTRTRVSFEIAEKRLSADTLNFAASGSAVEKGETLIDTAKNLMAMRPDMIVMRHKHPGAPKMLADRLPASIINAGDGAHEHPTQALLDAFTIRERLGRLGGVNVSIIGDIAHSRVVRSNIHLLTKMKANVTVAGAADADAGRGGEDGRAGGALARRGAGRRRRHHDAAHPARAAGEAQLPVAARVLQHVRPHAGAAAPRDSPARSSCIPAR